jgi:Flp pilus assembly protein TadG
MQGVQQGARYNVREAVSAKQKVRIPPPSESAPVASAGHHVGSTLRRTPRGQALVEMALILPLLMLLLLMAIDFGRVFFSYIQITNAAREAAAYAALSPTDTAGILAAAMKETDAQSQNGESAITIDAPTCMAPSGTVIACTAAKNNSTGQGNTISVTVRERFSFLTPLIDNFWQNSFQMGASATATVFGFVASGPGAPPSCSTPPTASFAIVADSTLTIYADPSASAPVSPDPCAISGYNWDWGDGSTEVGTATGVFHTYATSGSRTVTLQVTNQAGTSTATRSITVPAAPPPPVCAKPTATFTWTSSGKTRTYHDTSTVADPVNCPITDWLWTFTDLGTQTNVQNPPPQTYANNSAHPVTLKVTNAGGSTSITLNT